jgi:hypothetical protein
MSRYILDLVVYGSRQQKKDWLRADVPTLVDVLSASRAST